MSNLRNLIPGSGLMLLPRRAEAERRPFFRRRAQVPGVAGEEHRDAVVVFGESGAVAIAEPVEVGAVAVEPAGGFVRSAVEAGGEAVFGLQPGLQHVELQGAD